MRRGPHYDTRRREETMHLSHTHTYMHFMRPFPAELESRDDENKEREGVHYLPRHEIIIPGEGVFSKGEREE